jgi:F-type H+-transporting ATPase subunit b
MLIDWFTVGAQAINFLILVWLLKRLLYRPVLAAIDAREKKIAAQLQSAAQREAQAQQQRDDFQRRSETLERDREGILRSASAEAAAERQILLEAARKDSQALRGRLLEVVGKEREELGRRLVTQTQNEVVALTRQVLTDLAAVSLEERMVSAFIEKLRQLPQDSQVVPGQPSRPAADASGPGSVGTRSVSPVRAALVRSAFDLSLSQRAAIKTAVTESLGADLALHFESSPELVCGLELSVSGVKLAWSVSDYLGSVSQRVLALVEPARDPQLRALEASHG